MSIMIASSRIIHTMLQVPQNKLVIINLIEGKKTLNPCKIHKLGKKNLKANGTRLRDGDVSLAVGDMKPHNA